MVRKERKEGRMVKEGRVSGKGGMMKEGRKEGRKDGEGW